MDGQASLVSLFGLGVWLRKLSASSLALCLIGMLHPVWAHDVPPSIVMLDLGRDVVDMELQLPVSELGTALSLPHAAHPDTVVPQYGARIEQYLQETLQLRSSDGRAYVRHIDSLAIRTTDNANWSGNDWLVVHARLQAPGGTSTEVFALDYAVILQRVVSHEALIYVRRDIRNGLLGDKPMLISTAGFGNTHIQVDGSSGSWWQGFRHLFSLGMSHIAEGTDHVLFLLALLLSAPMVAVDGRWKQRKNARACFRSIVGIVSGFTLGHSISLALASAAWIVAPTRVVEILVAVSILVSCIHVWRPMFAGREVWVASAFGLVHGLAFAEMLLGLDFDGTTLALSLLGFNLGIESMQLLVIAVTLPLLLALGRTKHYAVVAGVGAGCAAVFAIAWILERALGLANPLEPVVNWLAPPPVWFTVALCLASGGLVGLQLWFRSRRGAGKVLSQRA